MTFSSPPSPKQQTDYLLVCVHSHEHPHIQKLISAYNRFLYYGTSDSFIIGLYEKKSRKK